MSWIRDVATVREGLKHFHKDIQKYDYPPPPSHGIGYGSG